MATPEHRLITRIITHGEIEKVLDWGITEDDFLNLQCRGFWAQLTAYYKQYQTRGSVIPEDAFRQMFPHFELVEAPHTTTEALCDDLRKQKLTISMRNVLEEVQALVDTDPLAAAHALRQLAESTISQGTSAVNDVFLSTHVGSLIQSYEMKEQGLIQPVIHWPWTPLDLEVGGISNEDFVLLWGRPKSLKTFVLNYIMAHAYLYQNRRIMCYTKEMTPDNMLLRVAAFLGELPYRETRLARLNKYDRATLVDLQRVVKERSQATHGQNDLIVLDGRSAQGQDGARWIRSKAKLHSPDAIFIDGIYLLHDDEATVRTADHMKLLHISRALRQIALDLRIPIIATMQANRQAAKNSSAELDEIAYSDAVSQDITHGFRVINERDQNTLALVAGGYRESSLEGIRINGVPCTDFSFHSLMSTKEILTSKQHDDADSTASPQASSKKRQPKKSTQAPDRAIQNQLAGI